MSLPRFVLILVVLLTGSAVSAGAQERIELFSNIGGVARVLELDATVSGFGTVRSVLPVAGLDYVSEGPVVLAGARYVVWPAGGGVSVFDRRTRRLATATLPGTVDVPVELVADPRQPRLLVNAATSGADRQMWVVDARTLESRLLFSTSDLVLGIAYAATADQLFVNLVSCCATFPPTHSTEVIDVATGASVRRLIRSDFLDHPQVSDDGRWLWGVNTGFNVGTLHLLDGHSGAIVARGPFVRAPFALDPQRGLVLAASSDDEFLLGLDALTFAEQWRSRLDLPAPLRSHGVSHQVLPGRWMTGAYALHIENRVDGVCQRLDVAAVDPDGTRRATAQLLPLAGATGSRCFASAVLVRSPFAPTGLTASVAAGTVGLAWTDPGDTTEFELEYGVAPGQRAGAIRVGATSQVAIAGVPPGIYYVRVRALNEVGSSPLSDEVRVVVQ